MHPEPNTDPKPSWRKPAGIIAILMIIFFWSLIVINIADAITGWPIIAQTIFYIIAGIIWIFPVRPLLTWMEIGRFKP